MKNIEYKSSEIVQFYSTYRMKYDDFYPSEKKVIEYIFNNEEYRKMSILDIGCACGGLGKALSEQFNIKSYTGVDINKDAIDWAKNNNRLDIESKFIYGDILHIDVDKADLVFSLSCADWNVETDAIIQKAWSKVKWGGYLIVSLRLTNKNSINDIDKSYQYIDPFNKGIREEKANYVVFNIDDALNKFNMINPLPSKIYAYGYFGKPSETAVTPFDKLLFSVFAVKKEKKYNKCQIKIDFPIEVFKGLKDEKNR